MPVPRLVIRAVAVACAVGGAGLFAVQSGYGIGIGNARVDTPAIPTSVVLGTAPAAPARPTIADSAGIRMPTQAIPVAQIMPGAPPAPGIGAMPADGVAQGDARGAVELSAFGLPCGLSVMATAMPGAMVGLDVMDPCQPDTRVEIAHSGLVFTGLTDALGLLTVDIPALQTPARVSVTLPDGRSETTMVALPDLINFDRAAVTWYNTAELALHAMERGAEFGGPGHVWQDAPGTIEDAIDGIGGFLTELGDPDVTAPRMAQVYTFPRRTLGAGDLVRLSIDAPVTDCNCGQAVIAQSLQNSGGNAIEVVPITLTLPGCDAVGDYLVLQNIFRDLRLARN